MKKIKIPMMITYMIQMIILSNKKRKNIKMIQKNKKNLINKIKIGVKIKINIAVVSIIIIIILATMIPILRLRLINSQI